MTGIQKRLIEAPIPPGNYSSLTVNDKALFWLATPAGEKKSSLKGAEITDERRGSQEPNRRRQVV